MPRWFVRVSCLATLTLVASACDPATPEAATREGASGSPGVVAPLSPDAPANAAGADDSDSGADAGPRVVFLGTSLTAGLGLRLPSERWPERLDQMADSAGTPIRVVNAGRSGDTSAGGRGRLEWLLRDTVDLLVIELGANDGLRGLPTDDLADNLRAIIDDTRAAWPEAAILMVGMEAPTNLGDEYTRRFRSVFATVAAEREVALVPFLLEGVAGEDHLNQPDRIHPTAEGHDRIAATVWPHLEPLLHDLSGESSP